MTLPEAAGVNAEAEGKAYVPRCPKRSVKAQTTTFPERYCLPGGESIDFCHTEKKKEKKTFINHSCRKVSAYSKIRNSRT